MVDIQPNGTHQISQGLGNLWAHAPLPPVQVLYGGTWYWVQYYGNDIVFAPLKDIAPHGNDTAVSQGYTYKWWDAAISELL